MLRVNPLAFFVHNYEALYQDGNQNGKEAAGGSDWLLGHPDCQSSGFSV